MKALCTVIMCVHVCMCFSTLPDDSYYQCHVAPRFIWNKHSQTDMRAHTSAHTLSSVLRWQAVIPALAYERQQLEGVAVTVVARLLCYPFGWQLLCSS